MSTLFLNLHSHRLPNKLPFIYVSYLYHLLDILGTAAPWLVSTLLSTTLPLWLIEAPTTQPRSPRWLTHLAWTEVYISPYIHPLEAYMYITLLHPLNCPPSTLTDPPGMDGGKYIPTPSDTHICV